MTEQGENLQGRSTQTQPKLSRAALDYLRWLRDNEHHFATWLPSDAPPEKVTHIELSGHGGRRKRVSAKTHEEARPYKTIHPPRHLENQRMLYPNEDGLSVLENDTASTDT
jgi:hypothetical protein